MEQRELERLMKEGDTVETLTPGDYTSNPSVASDVLCCPYLIFSERLLLITDELGFQNGREIRLLAKMYKAAAPLQGLCEATDEKGILSDEKVDNLVQQSKSISTLSLFVVVKPR